MLFSNGASVIRAKIKIQIMLLCLAFYLATLLNYKWLLQLCSEV